MLLEALEAQRGTFRLLWATPGARVPLAVIWVASFGGALHAPVTTYFYQQVGASLTDIGNIDFCSQVTGLLLSPFWGWVLDNRGGTTAIVVSCFLCSLGCLIRGVAPDVPTLYVAGAILGLGAGSLWPTVLAHLTKITPVRERHAVVSSYLLQVTVLRILGKAVYPAWHWWLVNVMQVGDPLFRDRLSMGVCTAFCIFGFLLLLLPSRELQHSPPRKPPPLGAGPAVPPSLADAAAGCGSRQLVPGAGRGHAGAVALALGLVCLTFATTSGTILWPIFVRDHFGWRHQEYAWALFGSSVVGTLGLAAYPTVAARIGAGPATTGAALLGVALAVLVFQRHGQLLHAVLATGFFGAASFLEPALKSQVSTRLPGRRQGATFGTMQSLGGLGRSAGSVVATRLYALSEHGTVGRGGALPMYAAALALALVAAAALAGDRLAPPPHPHAEGDQRGLEAASLPRELDSKYR